MPLYDLRIGEVSYSINAKNDEAARLLALGMVPLHDDADRYLLTEIDGRVLIDTTVGELFD